MADGTLQSVKVILRREVGGRGTTMEGINQTRVHCTHIWKCHSGNPLCNYYILIKMLIFRLRSNLHSV
jgi:hypothetical protein